MYIQRNAIRIITGAIRGTCQENLYQEINWVSTYERRNRKNLVTYFKLKNKILPKYMDDLIPRTTGSKSNYNLRNSDSMIAIPTRSSMYQNSFLPSVTNLWNTLPVDTTRITSINEFKNHLKKFDSKTPGFYYAGNRKGQMLLARMRMQCSPLKDHLNRMRIIEDRECECGHEIEDIEHYFFDCPAYESQRIILDEIDQSIDRNVINFLYGDRNKDNRQNANLLSVISKFIVKSKRFT